MIILLPLKHLLGWENYEEKNNQGRYSLWPPT